MLLAFDQHISIPILRDSWSQPDVRGHAIENRARASECCRHCLCVTFVKSVYILLNCRHRIVCRHLRVLLIYWLSTSLLLRRREISPEVSQTVISAEQGAEDRRIGKKDVTGAIAIRRHPQQHIELGIAFLGEWMRLQHIDWLARQHVDRVAIVSHSVVRQVHVKVESRDSVEKSLL